MAELVLLAVTKMLSGVCVGAVRPGGGPWIRPVKAFGSILPGDICYADGTWMEPFDLVDLNLLRARPDPPHTEDWGCDFVRPRPRRIRGLELEERRRLLHQMTQSGDLAAWEERRQSLAVLVPASVRVHFSLDPYSTRYEARLQWPGGGKPEGHPVTDLRWRALGRRLLPPSGGELTLGSPELAERLGCEEVFLGVGLSRSYQGEFWPIVIGVYCIPDYEVNLDPAHL